MSIVIELLLLCFRSTLLWSVAANEGVDLLTDDQLEQDYPISRALDLKDLVDPLLCQEYAYTISAVRVTRPEDLIG